jgi:multiple antibiotic resistance protein
MGTTIKNKLGGRGLRVMARITGLVLSALAAQMVMQGVKSFFATPN